MAKVDDFESEAGVQLREANLSGSAAGMALNVGETFLNDAEESDFERLRETLEINLSNELRVNATAFAETVDVFLEGGDEAEVVEKRGMEEVGKSADFAGHLLGEGAGAFERDRRSFLPRREGLANLSETEIDGKDGLREAVVEFAANAAALVILKLEEASGETVNGALGVFHFGDVRECGDDAHDVAVSIELGSGISKDPNEFARSTRETNAEDAVFDRRLGTNYPRNRTIVHGNFLAVFGEGDDAKIMGKFADGSAFGDAENAVSGGIGKFDATIRLAEDDSDMKITDECAEAFFTFAESFGSATLFRQIGNGNDDTGNFSGGIKFGDSVKEGPNNLGGTGRAHTDDLAAKGPLGGKDPGNGAVWRQKLGAIFTKNGEAEFLGGLTKELLVTIAESLLNSLVGEKDADLGIVDDDANVEIFDKGSETFLAGAKQVLGFLALGNVANNDEGAELVVNWNDGGAHLADADLARLGTETKFEIADMAVGGKSGKDLIATSDIHPKVHLARSLAEGFLTRMSGEASEAVVDLEIGTVGERIDAKGVGAVPEGGGKDFFGTAKSAFDIEEVVGNALLAAIGEKQANGRTDDGKGDREPGEDYLFASNGAAHEDNEKGNGDGEDLGIEHAAGARGRERRSGRVGLLPFDSKEDDDDSGDHPDEIAPTCGDAGVDNGEEIFSIGENEKEEDDGKDHEERAEPGGKRGARTEKEGEREDKVARKVNENNLAEEGGLVLLPARRGVEEIKKESDGENGHLEEIEEADGVDAGGVLAGERKKNHEDRSGPDEKEDVGGPGSLGGAGNETLVIGADGLA